jgi:hypothetical protein
MHNSNTAAAVNAAEQIGRDKFISIHSGMTWFQNPDRYGVWDMSGTTTTASGVVKNKFIEAKGRDITSSQYGTTFLELKKLDHLLDVAAANNAKAFYFVSYSDGKSFLFDLTNVKNKYAVQQIWCNDVTIGDSPTKKILKDVM